MSQYLINIRSGQQICRSVFLPMRGNVLVRTGQKVKEGDIIVECNLPERFLVFDVVNTLNIKASKAEARVERLIGEEVKKGDVIVQKTGIISKIFRAPEQGKVISIRDGKLALALGNKKVEKRATYPGIVVELIPERGAVICAKGSILEGVWGNGLNGSGTLIYLGGTLDNTFDQTAIGPQNQGKIVVVGPLTSGKVFNALALSNPAGIITSSLSTHLFENAKALNIPIMILIGFGEIFLDDLSESMILSMMGKKVYLSAQIPDLHLGVRPDVFLPSSEGTVEGLFQDETPLRIGRKVRLLGMPYTGGVGEVVDIPEEKAQFASGLWIQPVIIKRTDGEIIKVPINNVELIIQ